MDGLLDFPRFLISCYHVTSSRDNTERLFLMETFAIQSRATRLKSETLRQNLLFFKFDYQGQK